MDLKLGYQFKCCWSSSCISSSLCPHATMLDQPMEGDGSLLDHVVLFVFTEQGRPLAAGARAAITCPMQSPDADIET